MEVFKSNFIPKRQAILIHLAFHIGRFSYQIWIGQGGKVNFKNPSVFERQKALKLNPSV